MGSKGGGYGESGPVTYDTYKPLDFGGNINYGNLPHYSSLPGLQGGGDAYMGKNLDAAMSLHPEYFDAAHAHYRPEYAIAKAVRGAGNDPLSVVNALKAAGIPEGALGKYTLPQAWKYNLGMGVPGGSYDAFIKAWESGEGMPTATTNKVPAGMRRVGDRAEAGAGTGKKGGGAPSGGVPPVGGWGSAWGGAPVTGQPPATTKPAPGGRLASETGGKKGGGGGGGTGGLPSDIWTQPYWGGGRFPGDPNRPGFWGSGGWVDDNTLPGSWFDPEYRRNAANSAYGKKGGGGPAPRNVANVGRAIVG